MTNWQLRHGSIDFSAEPIVMGVLNVTPDSFSDGGMHFDAATAVRRADEVVEQGAGIIDVGPESTRPGSDAVSPEVQIARIDRVIAAIREHHPRTPISIDTRSAQVAAAAIELGADIINDVSALRDDETMADVARDAGAPVILMHMRGRPKTMQADPAQLVYNDVVQNVKDFLAERIAWAKQRGLDCRLLAIDPGIGFGKTEAQNLTLIRRLADFTELGLPVVLGASRKRFIGKIVDRPDPKHRLFGSLACAAAGALVGAHIIRAHDVAETVEVVRMAHAIRSAQQVASA
jgi:dihydropteroate synthase